MAMVHLVLIPRRLKLRLGESESVPEASYLWHTSRIGEKQNRARHSSFLEKDQDSGGVWLLSQIGFVLLTP